MTQVRCASAAGASMLSVLSWCAWLSFLVVSGEALPLVRASAARGALETMEWQIGLFDSLPKESQTAFLMVSAENIDRIVPMMDSMVAEWLAGDADGLAELMNEGLTDPALADALLYKRNENWAEWINTRLERPGTVFIAVGAGHLAGQKSVQDFLTQRGLTVERVQ